MKILDNLSIEDIFFEDEFYEILVSPNNFETVSNAFDENNIIYDGEITLLPSNTVKISDSDLDKVVKLLELLEDHEDVQKVYSNFEVEKW